MFTPQLQGASYDSQNLSLFWPHHKNESHDHEWWTTSEDPTERDIYFLVEISSLNMGSHFIIGSCTLTPNHSMNSI
jgi:hypothetical protein